MAIYAMSFLLKWLNMVIRFREMLTALIFKNLGLLLCRGSIYLKKKSQTISPMLNLLALSHYVALFLYPKSCFLIIQVLEYSKKLE